MSKIARARHARKRTRLRQKLEQPRRRRLRCERIAEARKALGLTQAQLADTLGVAQQVVASYEVVRRRVPTSFLPRLARTLALPGEELIGEEPQRSRRGPAPRLLHQVERIQRLPKPQQRFVMQMIDTALQASATAAE